MSYDGGVQRGGGRAKGSTGWPCRPTRPETGENVGRKLLPLPKKREKRRMVTKPLLQNGLKPGRIGRVDS